MPSMIDQDIGIKNTKRLSNSTVYDYQTQYNCKNKIPSTFSKKFSKSTKKISKKDPIHKECNLYVPNRKCSTVDKTLKFEDNIDIEAKFKTFYNMSNIW
jgi:hypothetical protein